MQSLPLSDAGQDGRLRLIVSSYHRLTGKPLFGDDLLLPPCTGKGGMGVELANSDVSTPTLATPARGTPKVGNPHPTFGWAELTPPVGAPPHCGDPSAVPLQGGGDVAAAALREALWNAPRAIVAHGTEDDPIFFYGNRLALQLFEMSFDEFTRLPSRLSAEPLAQEARVRWLRSNGLGELDVGGAGLILADAAVVYRAEGHLGMVLRVELGAGDVRTRSFELLYRLSDADGGKEIARVKTGVLCFDYASRKVVSLTAPLRAALAG